jgi:hypothetical protein
LVNDVHKIILGVVLIIIIITLQPSSSQESSSLSSYFTLVGLAIRHVDVVSKSDGLLVTTMLANALQTGFSSSLELFSSSSSSKSSLS